MPVKERQIIGMKYPNIAPEGYCCDKCHAHGVKLWCGDEAEGLDLSLTEFIPSSVRKLLCANCAEADQKVFMHNGWKSDYLLKINGGRDIGHLFPALPAEDKENLFYGDYEMPSYAMLWWDRLPASNPVQVMG